MLKKVFMLLLYVLVGTICYAQEIVFEDEEFQTYEIIGNDTIFVVVEEMPVYPGSGINDLLSYIGNEFVYPEDAKEKGIEGRVVISFIIDIDGRMKDFAIERSIYPTLDNEAIRVLKSIPYKWKPGKMKGKAVRVKYTLPINFRIPNDMKSNEMIIEQFITENLNEEYEFHIVEIEQTGKFDYEILKNEYEIPEIITEETEENKKIFSEIKNFVEKNIIDSYISVVIGTRLKGSDSPWTPSWYLVFLDEDRNILNMFYYYP